MKPELSILIVSYNSRTDLIRCLPTIRAQTFSDYEIIVVDNHGHDGVADLLRSEFPDIRLVSNPHNTGYAGGNNVGLTHVQGRWVLLLNPDTELRPRALMILVETVRANQNAFVTPKLLNPDGISVNACGNQMHYTGITTCRGLNDPADTYHGLQTVPLLSGAAFIAPADAIRQLNGFDESYFMYFEDTDLSMRARLLGYRLLCQADAEIIHHYRLGMNPQKFYHLERNRLLTFMKVLSKTTLRQLLPALVLTELATWAYALRGWPYLRARFRGYRYLWQHRKAICQTQQAIQQTRRLTDRDLLAGSQVALPIAQVTSGGIGKIISDLSAKIYTWLRPYSLR
ncbi:glycosyl transferase family protein [Fibrisoma limi BUZ 3]|uniref:Glycosyl transferase family protein n=1 Tax=Fibrisoma limi BUZ 3 TaxID=1185876 RepID=I2GSK9_9BACT|nr:glycosyltransferase family 2 protein [Fibrisoma limi]CCH56888.1 glycosyl transferase family protein [Fibrisoma limi BUZ 3]